MKVGIMQPYFFPYLGYISLIRNTDLFILFDDVQYIRHGWIERNRVLKQGTGWNYIQVPIKKNKGRETLIKDLEVRTNEKWRERILGQLTIYKKKAPFYKEVIELINETIDDQETNLVKIIAKTLRGTCDYLGIEHDIRIYSEMGLEISKEQINEPDDWALHICKKITGVEEYWNPPGGKQFFNKSKYDNEKIKLKFHEITLHEYPQLTEDFVAGLSILDLLMFNSPKEVLSLDDFTLS